MHTRFIARNNWVRMRANTCTETHELVRKMPNVESRQRERPLNPHLNSCLTTILWTLKFLARDDNLFYLSRILSPDYLCYHYRLSSPIILTFSPYYEADFEISEKKCFNIVKIVITRDKDSKFNRFKYKNLRGGKNIKEK